MGAELFIQIGQLYIHVVEAWVRAPCAYVLYRGCCSM